MPVGPWAKVCGCGHRHVPWQSQLGTDRSPPCQGLPVLITSPLMGRAQSLRGTRGPAAIRTEVGLVQGPGRSLQTPPVAQVRSRRCDVKTKFVTHTPCTVCPAIKKRVCPSGWLREFPEKIEDCRCGPPPPSLPTPGGIPWGVGRPGRAWPAWQGGQGLTSPHVCWLLQRAGQAEDG